MKNNKLKLRYSKVVLPVSVSILPIISMAQDKPNLLIFHTDEHNFRTLGCYRETLDKMRAEVWGEGNIVETPHIDSIAKKGVLCTSFYATSPVCSPSRSSFMTGQYPQNTPVKENDTPMSDDVETFAQVLLQNGYATGYAGKWHLDGGTKPGFNPVRHFGFEDNDYMFNRGHWKKLIENEDGSMTYTENISGTDSTNFTTDFLTNKAIDFITENTDKPFCYMISYPDPHGPNKVRDPYQTMYSHLSFSKPATASKSSAGLPSWGPKENNIIGQDGLVKYFGMVKCIDDNIGKLIRFLEDSNLIDNTIIIFTSDHGDLLGEHGRDEKGVPYEGSSKIPFVISYPEKLNQGDIINQALSCVDFKPTILSIMGVEASKNSEGYDASALFLKDTVVEKPRDIAFVRGTGRSDRTREQWIGAFTDQYKLIYSPYSDPWLIDLENDPDELINQFEEESFDSIKKSLATELYAYLETYNDPYLNNSNIVNDIDITINGEIEDTLPVIDQSEYIISFADSEETSAENGRATNAIDGNPSTYWHTEWSNSKPPHPHEIQIDLEALYDIEGLRYLPRQDKLNGTIADYEIYVSDDKDNWGTAVATGTWSADNLLKEVLFDKKEGRYVSLRALSEVNNKDITSVAEIYLIGTYVGPVDTDDIIISRNELDIMVYPNPATSIISVVNNNLGEELFGRLISMDGRVITSFKMSDEVELQVGGLSNGIYLINLTDKEGKIIKNLRFIKK